MGKPELIKRVKAPPRCQEPVPMARAPVSVCETLLSQDEDEPTFWIVWDGVPICSVNQA